MHRHFNKYTSVQWYIIAPIFTGRIFGNLMAILTIMKSLPLAYNKDMQEDKERLFDTLDTLYSCLEIITPLLQNITFNTKLMLLKASSGYLDATSLLERFVTEGMPFRDAHHKVAKLVAIAIENDLSLKEIYSKGGNDI